MFFSLMSTWLRRLGGFRAALVPDCDLRQVFSHVFRMDERSLTIRRFVWFCVTIVRSANQVVPIGWGSQWESLLISCDWSG